MRNISFTFSSPPNSVGSRTAATSHVGHNSSVHATCSGRSRTDAVTCNWKGLKTWEMSRSRSHHRVLACLLDTLALSTLTSSIVGSLVCLMQMVRVRICTWINILFIFNHFVPETRHIIYFCNAISKLTCDTL